MNRAKNAKYDHSQSFLASVYERHKEKLRLDPLKNYFFRIKIIKTVNQMQHSASRSSIASKKAFMSVANPFEGLFLTLLFSTFDLDQA